MQGQFGTSPRNLAAQFMLADLTALSSVCEICRAEALFSVEPLGRCGALAGSEIAAAVAGKIVAVMIPHPEGVTGRNGLPESCVNAFDNPATIVSAIEVVIARSCDRHMIGSRGRYSYGLYSHGLYGYSLYGLWPILL